ncbi:hypothetical protein [Streptomyces sp. SID13031]|uniref:hypothetical protein n=1 Tax=Streptomyces sp. SID13031 TaxID=2706046 RepID=UPI0013C5F0A7|nr:hypothetical protein [Streptomyces sp. SID13031]NEA34843.1 hypothetical protein [Streptomyces sp. SID13031]
MSGFALAVSFLALVVSLVAAVFTYQQKVAAEGTLKVESDRLTDERMPTFDASIVTHDGEGGGWYHLALRLDTPWHLAKVHVSIPEHHGMSFTPDQRGIEAGALSPILMSTGGPLEPARDLTWRVQFDESHAHEARLPVTCSDRDGRHWTVSVVVALPTEAWFV